MHKFVLVITHAKFPDTIGKIISVNPIAIPRIGDTIDMMLEPLPKVKDVVWNYNDPNQTHVHAYVE
jgi:hypothetical protein